MALKTSLTGRLRNTTLPKTIPLLPLFEAVVNAIQAIDALPEGSTKGEVRVKILRSNQLGLGEFDSDDSQIPAAPIVGFEIQDDGEGFHDENMQSFQVLDSDYKAKDGCRGVGRLLWLKAFGEVSVRSVFSTADSGYKSRSFRFVEADEGVIENKVEDTDATTTGTIIRLSEFKKIYQGRAPKSAGPIAKDILEHCLWYFIRSGGAPRISVIDELADSFSLDDLFSDYMDSTAQRARIQVAGHDFDLLHLRLKVSAKGIPFLHWCAANRVVKSESLSGKIAGLHGRLSDESSEFMYACFLSGDYLDEYVRPERTAFDILESNDGTFFSEDPSMSSIRATAHQKIEEYLEPMLQKVKRAGRERVEKFIDTKSPRYRPILHHLDENELDVDPGVADKDLEAHLHRQFANLEGQLLEEGQRVLNPALVNDEGEYERRLADYLARVEDVKKSDLAAYVSRRRVILDILAQSIRVDEDGNYAREDRVHNLIMPMGHSSKELLPNASNLWIIDEGLAFHNYLTSDKTINSMPITGSASTKRPDLLGLTLTDSPILVSDSSSSLASITVVELKRPMRHDSGDGPDKNPIEQALHYLDNVREGRVQTPDGRPIPESHHIPGFVYILADLTPSMKLRCKDADLSPTQDGRGYFGYRNAYKAYVEVMSYDRLLESATRRNRAFFEQLGLPSS